MVIVLKKNDPTTPSEFFDVSMSSIETKETKAEQEKPTHDQEQKEHEAEAEQEAQEIEKEQPKPKEDQEIDKVEALIFDAFKPSPIETKETKAEQEKPTHDQEQKEHEAEAEQETQEIEKEQPKPKEDQEIDKVEAPIFDAFKPSPIETKEIKVEQEKPTHDQEQKEHEVETKQEIQEVEKKWPFKPKKDQKINKAKARINFGDKAVKITRDDLWYFYQQFFLGTLAPTVQLRYNKPSIVEQPKRTTPDIQLRDGEFSLKKEEKKPTIHDALYEMRYFLSLIRSFISGSRKGLPKWVFEEHIRKNYSSPEEFFNKVFDMCNDFIPLDERFALFFKEAIKPVVATQKSSYDAFSFFDWILTELGMWPDPLIIFKEPNSVFFSKSKSNYFSMGINKKSAKKCEKILLNLMKSKKLEGERDLQDKKKIFAESTFFKHSVPGKKSFYERTKELLQLELSVKNLFNIKSRWIESRRMLLEDEEVEIVSFDKGYNASEIPVSWGIDQILKERIVGNFNAKMNDSLPKDPDLLEYFVFLILTNARLLFIASDLRDNLKFFLENLKKEDKARVANMRIEFVEGNHSILLPLPVFLCFYRESYGDHLPVADVMKSIGLDAFNVKFEFDGKEHDIMSFLEEIQRSHPEEAYHEHLPTQEREFNCLFKNAAKLCDKLKAVKEKLEIAENKEQTTVSSNQPQRSEKTPSTKIEAFGHSEPSRNSLNVDEKTKEEETKPNNTTRPDTKVHVIKLNRVSRNAANEIVSVA